MLKSYHSKVKLIPGNYGSQKIQGYAKQSPVFHRYQRMAYFNNDADTYKSHCLLIYKLNYAYG